MMMLNTPFDRIQKCGVLMRAGLWVVAVCPTSAIALTQDELDANRDVWTANGSQDYDYVLQPLAFLVDPPGLVKVRAGEVTAILNIHTQKPLNPLSPQRYRTVDGLFGVLQDELDRPAFRIDAEFDNSFGYPTTIWIDRFEWVSDEEYGFIARDLTLVPEPSTIALMVAAIMMLSVRGLRPSNSS